MMVSPLPDLFHGQWVLAWTLLGLFIGSFLNVCIHRLPLEDESVSNPRRSRCPKCKTTLTWKENLPLISWLVQLGRCRHCGWGIPMRYPLVEMGNAGLWYLAITTAGVAHPGLWVTWSVVLSALVVATMVDFAYFEIPDEISIGGMLLAPLVCLAVPELHADTLVARYLSGWPLGEPLELGELGEVVGTVGRWGALVGCLSGMAAGGGSLWIIGWIGSRAYKTEAMGFGDVKLLAAGGGLVGPGGALVALMIAAVFASVFGLGNMVRFFCLSRGRARARGGHGSLGRSIRTARIAGRYLPFGPFLALGIGIVLMAWDDVLAFWQAAAPGVGG